jgi:glycosyltransferase involved in cell wall biosynthesis
MSIHGVLVTYQRPSDLATMLERLAGQSKRLDTLVIVDNGDPQDPGSMTRSGAAESVTYLPSGDNLGPAGGLRVGCDLVLEYADLDDWVLFLDDDDPPGDDGSIEALHRFAVEQAVADPSLGGVGLVGARLDRRSGLLRRIPDADLAGAVSVDYLGGGQLPMYRVAALADARPEPALFFGFDDLDVGLGVLAQGFRLYCDGAVWRQARSRSARLGLGASLPSRRQPAPTWRSYYSHRNMVYILRSHGLIGAAAWRSVTIVGKAIVNLPLSPRTSLAALGQAITAVLDGWRGRLGRTVQPD